MYEFVSEPARADVYAELTETRRRILHRRRPPPSRPPRDPSAPTSRARPPVLPRPRRPAGGRPEPPRGRRGRRGIRLRLRGRPPRARARVPASPRPEGFGDRAPSPHRARRGPAKSSATSAGRRRSSSTPSAGPRPVRRPRTSASRSSDSPERGAELSRYASSRELATDAFDLLDGPAPQRRACSPPTACSASTAGGSATSTRRRRTSARRSASRSPSGSPAELGHGLIDLANTLSSGGRTPHGRRAVRPGRRRLRADPQPSAQARVLMNRALLHTTPAGRGRRPRHDRGDHGGRALAGRRSGSATAAQHGPVRGGAEERSPRGRSLDRAVALLAPLGDQLADQQATMARGMIAEVEGNFDAAEATFRTRSRLARELGLSAEIAEMLLRLARPLPPPATRRAAKLDMAEAREAGICELRGDLAGQVEVPRTAAAPRKVKPALRVAPPMARDAQRRPGPPGRLAVPGPRRARVRARRPRDVRRRSRTGTIRSTTSRPSARTSCGDRGRSGRSTGSRRPAVRPPGRSTSAAGPGT